MTGVAFLVVGQPAFVRANGIYGGATFYVLQDAVGPADGVSVLDTLDNPALQWIVPKAALRSTGGSVALTDTPYGVNLEVAPLSVATPAALALRPVLGVFPTGTQAFVTSNGFVYTLQPKPTGVSADTNGSYVLATNDDATRLWVKAGLLSVPQQFVSVEINFMTSTPVAWGADWPVIGAGKAPIIIGLRPLITALGGTSFSANAGCKIGTNGGTPDNIFSTPNFFVFGSLNGMLANGVTKNAAIGGLTQGANNTALTGLDVVPTVTPTSATGVGTTLKARIVLSMAIVDMAP